MKKISILHIALVFILIANTHSDSRLLVKENSESPPFQKDKSEPLELSLGINIKHIEVRETKQEVRIEASLKTFWTDERIGVKDDVKFDGVENGESYVVTSNISSVPIWIPDIFIENCVTVREPKYHTPPTSLRVYNTSKIRFNKRMNFDISCPMNYVKYPFDTQECEVKFESFSYLEKQLQMRWDKDQIPFICDIKLHQFEYEAIEDAYDDEDFQLEQHFEGAKLTINLSRRISSFLFQTYIPSLLLCFLGYIVLFIPPYQASGRVTLGMLTFLNLLLMGSQVRRALPSMSYETFLDVWFLFSEAFLCCLNVLSILEIILIEKKLDRTAWKLNRLSKIIIPILFAIFVAGYWVTALMWI